MWMNSSEWYEWIVAHRRGDESAPEAAERLAVTHAYLECRGKPLDGRPYRIAMAKMLHLRGKFGTQSSQVCRMIQKHDLIDVVLR